MRVLCCLDGTNTERLAQQIFTLLIGNDLQLVLLYVVDVGPGHELDRRVLGPNAPPHPPGPKSIGHTARFVIDHAPCPVLLRP